MKEHETVDCNDLVNYLTGDCTELERAAFERHLRTCASCREELRTCRMFGRRYLLKWKKWSCRQI